MCVGIIVSTILSEIDASTGRHFDYSILHDGGTAELKVKRHCNMMRIGGIGLRQERARGGY